MKKIYLIIVLITLAVGTAFWFSNKQGEPTLVVPKVSKVVESVFGIGIIKSHQVFKARVALVMLMEKIFVKEGQEIKKGDALFRVSERNIVVAPFNGTVTHIAVNDAEMVFPQNDILIMENLNQLYVEVSLEQIGAVKIKKNQQVTLSFDSLPREKSNGIVTAILPHEDKFKIIVEPEVLPKSLLPGMSVDATFIISQKENAVLVPLKAVTNGHIFLFKNEKKVRTKIETGLQDGTYIEIIAPALSLSEQIVISP